MIGITLAVLLGASDVEHGWQNYAAAYRTVMEANRPLVVLVSAQWCGPCQLLKHTVLPDPRIRKLLKECACAIVDVDEQPRLARKLGGSGGVPLLVVYRKTKKGWKRRELRGYQSVESLQRFIGTD